MDSVDLSTVRTIENHPKPEYTQEEIENVMLLYGLVYMRDAIKILDSITKDE